MAMNQRKTTPWPLVHSDSGTHFTSDAFQEKLADNYFVQSLRMKGDYRDKVVIESFFGTLKQELAHRVKYKTRHSIIQCIVQ